MHVTARNREKFIKTLYFEGSRSFKVINVNTVKKLERSSLVLVTINNMSVPICNRFYARLANSSKIKTFRVVPSFTPSFEGNPLTQQHENFVTKSRVHVAGYCKDSVILAYIVLIQYSSVSDGHMDRKTDRP